MNISFVVCTNILVYSYILNSLSIDKLLYLLFLAIKSLSFTFPRLKFSIYKIPL